MGDAIRILFWLWVFGSIAVLIVRVYRRIDARPSAEASPTIDEDLLVPPTPPGRPREPSRAAPADAAPADARRSTTNETARPEPAPEPSADDGPDEPPRTREAAAPTGGRRGLFAGVADEPAATASATLAEAVRGMSWPCDLAPVVADQIPAALDRRVVFATTTADAAEVGRQLGDELERAGFSVDSVSDEQAVARRGADTVELSLYPSAGDATIAGERRFPTVDPSAVVVEVRLT